MLPKNLFAIKDDKFYYLAYFILIVVLLYALNELIVFRKKTISGFREGLKNNSELSKTSTDKEKELKSLITQSDTLKSKLEINIYGKATDNRSQPLYTDILEEMEDMLELKQLFSIMEFQTTARTDEDLIKLGEKLNLFKKIREACIDSRDFLTSDRYNQ